MKIELNIYDDSFLDFSWIWLNDPEIKYLTNTPDFTKEDQIKWYTNIKNVVDYQIWGLSILEKPIGACGLKNIKTDECEYWGYIGNKEFLGLGLGAQILEYMAVEAKKIGMKRIWLKVIKDNPRAISFYLKSGFKEYCIEGGIIYMQKMI